jgi:hypothetical protein
VPAGQYKPFVSRNGYVTEEYGQKKPGEPGATFTLRPGQRIADVLFKLGRAGEISGRVFDEDGEPLVGVAVCAMRQAYKDGRKSFQVTTQEETNDLGEFRVFGLAPGRYYISAEMPGWERVVGDREFSGSEKGSGDKGYAKIYCPSAQDVAGAIRSSAAVSRAIVQLDLVRTGAHFGGNVYQELSHLLCSVYRLAR